MDWVQRLFLDRSSNGESMPKEFNCMLKELEFKGWINHIVVHLLAFWAIQVTGKMGSKFQGFGLQCLILTELFMLSRSSYKEDTSLILVLFYVHWVNII